MKMNVMKAVAEKLESIVDEYRAEPKKLGRDALQYFTGYRIVFASQARNELEKSVGMLHKVENTVHRSLPSIFSITCTAAEAIGVSAVGKEALPLILYVEGVRPVGYLLLKGAAEFIVGENVRHYHKWHRDEMKK